jgi:thioredoxin:protein disulfide reductase
MLDFYADWCASCKVMEKTTLRAPKVVSALNSFVVLTVDLTANDANARALLRHFDLIAPPAFLFFNGKDEVRRLVGEVSATQLLSALNASTH